MAKAIYLEDLSVGTRFESAEYEMTAEAIIAFAREFDPQPFHTDPNAAGDSFFQGLAASGWHTASVTMRLLVDAVPLAQGVIGASGTIAWPTPTRAGDLLRVVASVEDIAQSRSKPGRAMVAMRCETRNQHGELRQEFSPNVIAWSRTVDPEAG